VDHDQGVLHYHISEDKRKLPPRASLHLWGAVVAPSEEDSQSFSIQAANNETYRLKAADARERQEWVSKLRQEVEHANSLAAGSKELLQASQKSSVSLSPPTSTAHNMSNGSSSTGTTPHKRSLKKSQLSAPINLSITKTNKKQIPIARQLEGVGEDEILESYNEEVDSIPGGDSMIGSLTALQSLHEKLLIQLEKSEEVGLLPHDKNLLLFKATSSAAVGSIQDCLAMMNLHLGQTTPTLLDSARPSTHKKLRDRSSSMVERTSLNSETHSNSEFDQNIIPPKRSNSVTTPPVYNTTTTTTTTGVLS
jgi:hypothetical protein